MADRTPHSAPGHLGRTPLVPLGTKAGGCTEACSEGHTYSWPCEQSMVFAERSYRFRSAFWRAEKFALRHWPGFVVGTAFGAVTQEVFGA